MIVAARPSIKPPQLPLLHEVEHANSLCAEKAGLVLPVEGAPLVFATRYAHDMELQLWTKSGKVVSVPAHANAEQGGFVIDGQGLNPAEFGDTVPARLHGKWGFQPFDGPEFRLENAHAQPWKPAPGETQTLVVGQDAVVHLHTGNAACVERIGVKMGGMPAIAANWAPVNMGEVQVRLPLKDAQPGRMVLRVHQYGLPQPETVTLQSFAEPAELAGFRLHAGDQTGELKGTRLEEVASLEVNGVKFAAENPTPSGVLVMKATDPEEYKTLTAGSATAHVRLKDGRVLAAAARIEARRPVVKLLAKSIELTHGEDSHIRLAGQNELPQTATLRFSVKADIPHRFDRGETIEVGTADSVFTTTLTMLNGGLTLQDLHTAVATLRPAKAFGESAFGPLEFRVVDKGVAGKWHPLMTLVRLPKLKKLKCGNSADAAQGPGPADAGGAAMGAQCELTGQNLFLVDAVANDPSFQNEVQVPDGFPGDRLAVPQPAAGQLYLKLRDDPSAVNIVALKSATPKPKRRRAHEKRSAATETKKPLPFNPGGTMIPATGPAPQATSQEAPQAEKAKAPPVLTEPAPNAGKEKAPPVLTEVAPKAAHEKPGPTGSAPVAAKASGKPAGNGAASPDTGAKAGENGKAAGKSAPQTKKPEGGPAPGASTGN